MAWASGDTVTSAALNYRSGYVVNAKDPAYGATGDGSTDDTAAIQAALNAAAVDSATTPTMSRVYLPAGSYLVTQLSIPRGVELYGDGSLEEAGRYGTRLLQSSSANKDMIRFGPVDSSYFAHGVGLTRMSLYGDSSNTTGGAICSATTSDTTVVWGQDVRIRDLSIRSFVGDGIRIPNRALPLLLKDIYITECNAGIRFVPNTGAAQITQFENISVDDNTDGGIVIDNTDGSPNDTFLITNLKAEKRTDGSQETAIVLKDMGGAVVAIHGVNVQNVGSSSSMACVISLEGSDTPTVVSWTGVHTRSQGVPVLIDAVSALTVFAGAHNGIYGPTSSLSGAYTVAGDGRIDLLDNATLSVQSSANIVLNNAVELQGKLSSGVSRNLINYSAANDVIVGHSTASAIRLTVGNLASAAIVHTDTGIIESSARTFRLASPHIPGSGTDTGVQGDMSWGTVSGTTYFYVCTSTNSWQRVALNPF